MFDRKYLPQFILRVSLGLVFLYFGLSQAISPDAWGGYVPEFLTGTWLIANNWVILNSIIELTLGTFLIIGLYTRFASLVLSLHLFAITLSIGFSPVGVRDFGLAFATLVAFLNGIDKNCLDWKFKKKSSDDLN